jgi:hypothetical protein
LKCSYHFKKWQEEGRQGPHALPADASYAPG